MSEEFQGPERRKTVRVYQDLPAECVLIDAHSRREVSEHFKGELSNISDGGALLETARIKREWLELLRNSTAEIALVISISPHQEPVRASAKMAWDKEEKELTVLKKHLLGLMFVNISDQDRARIKKFVIDSYLKSWSNLNKKP